MIQHAVSTISRQIFKSIYTTASVVSVGLSLLSSAALAAGVDGNYRVISGKGTLFEDGESLTITKSMIAQIIKGQSAISVKGQKMKITQNMTRAFLQPLATGTNISFNPAITGPSSITLLPVGNYFTGRSYKPVIVEFSYIEDRRSVGLVTQTNVVATIKGNTLTLTIRCDGVNDVNRFNGVITLVARR